MIRLLIVASMLLLAACEATVPAPQASLSPDTPRPPAGTPPTSVSPTETRVPTNTPRAIPPSVTPIPPTVSAEPEATRIVVTISPLLQTDIVPPVRLNLPSGWNLVSDAKMLPAAADEMSVVPFGYYSGPVPGGTGVVTILFGFNSIVPEFGDRTLNVYADALRMLLFAVIEPTCEYSFEEERTFSVGGRTARGTVYSANQCPDNLPSIHGWFAALNVDGLNFAFYAYTEPIEAMTSATRSELQAILDSVEFDFSLLPTAAPEAVATP